MDKEVKETLGRIAKAIEEIAGMIKEYLGRDEKHTQLKRQLEECRELMWKTAIERRLIGEG